MNNIFLANYNKAVLIYDNLIDKLIDKINDSKDVVNGINPINIYITTNEKLVLKDKEFFSRFYNCITDIGFDSFFIEYNPKQNTNYIKINWSPQFLFNKK